jgi:hypothetical protein
MLTALIGLMLAVGLAVGSLAWRITSTSPPITSLTLADPAVGYAFYDAVDRVLAGDDPGALETLVSDDFIDHGATHDETGSAGDFIAQLTAFRQSFPDTRIEVNDMQAASGTLIVALAPLAPPPARVAGLPLTIDPFARGYEVLRVRNGQVTERWSSGLPEIELHSFDDVMLSASALQGRSVHLDRFELPGAGLVSLQNQGESMMMVESGKVRVHMRWIDGNAGEQSDVLFLEAGETNRLPPGAAVTFEAGSDELVRVLRISIQIVRPVDPVPPAVTGGATDELLWSSNLPPRANGSWRLSIGTVRLPAYSGGLLDLDGGRLIAVCSDGSLNVTTHDGEVLALDEHFWPAEMGSSNSIRDGQAASIEDAESVALRSESGAVLWLIALSGGESIATPEPSASSAGA